MLYIIKCLYCQKERNTKRRPSNGRGKYCSSNCALLDYKSKPKMVIQPKPNVKCSWCSKPFYKNKSRQVKSKSGLFFCCRQHKDLAQRLGGISEIHPEHYGTSGRAMEHYRTKAFEQLENKCKRCGYEEYKQLLQVHHIDHDKSNNDISNLEILCVMCH